MYRTWKGKSPSRRVPGLPVLGSLTGLRPDTKVYDESCGRLCCAGVGGLVVEKTGKLGMLHNNGGVALDGVEVFFLKAVARFCGNEHLAGDGNGAAGVFGGDRFPASQSFINADDKFGDVVEPGELLVVDDEAEEFTGGDMTMLAFVFAALHFEEGLVELEKGEAEGNEFFARGGIAGGIMW
jgi:hypothetical protein